MYTVAFSLCVIGFDSAGSGEGEMEEPCHLLVAAVTTATNRVDRFLSLAWKLNYCVQVYV